MKNKLSTNTILDGIKEGKTIAMNCYTLTDNFVKNLETVLSKYPTTLRENRFTTGHFWNNPGASKLDLSFQYALYLLQAKRIRFKQ
jgi:hypothetical protein